MKFIIFFLLIFFIFPINLFAANIDKISPVDPAIESVLSMDRVAYISSDSLFVKKYNTKPLKIAGNKPGSIIISPPDIHAYDDSIIVSYIEKNIPKNNLFLAKINSKKMTDPEYFHLSSNSTARNAKIYQDNSSGTNNIYILESSTNSSQIKLYFFDLNTNRIETKNLTGFTGDNIYSLSPVFTDKSIYFCYYSTIDNGKEKSVIISEFDKKNFKILNSTSLKNTEGVSFIYGLSAKNTPFFIFKSSKEGKFQLNIARLKDNNWEIENFRDFDGLDVARLDYHVWNDGHIVIVLSAEEIYKFKQRVYALFSDNSGESFKIQRIDCREFDNTRSWLPRLVVTGNSAIAVWEDSRNIRSQIYYNISNDMGKTWKNVATPLSKSRYYAIRPAISQRDDGIFVAWQQYKDDTRKEPELILTSTSLKELESIQIKQRLLISDSRKKKNLINSLHKYWNAMINKNYRTVYHLHDPFFRARISYDIFSSKTGAIVYNKFKIDNIIIRGNEASVKISVSYEVSDLIMGGQDTLMSPKDAAIEDVWLYIDGLWHRKYVDVLTGASAVNY